ncbi:MAG: 6-phosphogluconolactonase [Lysobacterales bacterium]
MPVSLHQFASRSEASVALAQSITRQLRQHLLSNDAATLIVSGGTSPLQVFSTLAKTPLPWARIHVLPSDERKVDAADPASNLGMIRRELAVDRAARAKLFDLQREGAEQHLTELPAPTVHTMLGMGADGHTASLFPTAPQLAEALQSGDSMVDMSPPDSEHQRITLTAGKLLDSRRISLLIFGEDKRAVLNRAMLPGPTEQLPVRAVLHQQRAPVDVYWSA